MTYLITFTTYGTHLHGDERGSVDPNHNVPGTRLCIPDAPLNQRCADELRCPPYLISPSHADVILQAIRTECEPHSLYAAHVRTNHVHVVLESPISPERMMTALKAHATKLLRRSGLIAADRKIWTRHGSTVSLKSLQAIRRAITYVMEAQGEPIASFQSEALDRKE